MYIGTVLHQIYKSLHDKRQLDCYISEFIKCFSANTGFMNYVSRETPALGKDMGKYTCRWFARVRRLIINDAICVCTFPHVGLDPCLD